MIYRLIYFVLLLLMATFVSPLISIPLAFIYAMRWYAPELILMGYMFDVYFGSIFDLPYYTIGLALLVVISEIAKRFLLLKNS